MLVRMWMSTELMTVSPETTVADALKLMSEKKIRRLPILQGADLVGIIALSDLQKASMNPGLAVREIMAKNPARIAADAPIEDAGVVMRDRKIGALPVMEGKKLIGLITETDVFRALIEVLGLKKEGTRIAVEINRDPRAFYDLMTLVGESERAMLSCVLYHSYSKDHVLAVIRVEGSKDDDDLVQKLWASKCRVVSVS